jgi:hypothetical protein
MNPSHEQIGLAAYLRWERRGREHGRHLEDWVAAERALRFQGNYVVSVSVSFEGTRLPPVESARRGVCRYCEQAAPRTRFSGPTLAYPESLGNAGLLALDQCDECRGHFDETLDRPLAMYLQQWSEDPEAARRFGTIPIPAYKGLVRAALALMPPRMLETCPDALEWVNNPEHELDGLDAHRYGPILHEFAGPIGSSWAALASRTDIDEPLPAILAFFGFGRWTVELPVPHCLADDELDGLEFDVPLVPRVADPVFATAPVAIDQLAISSFGAHKLYLAQHSGVGVG